MTQLPGRSRQADQSPRPMRGGRRSTTWFSARCSRRGRHAAIAAAERIGGRILEVGVGTGISLPDYSPDNRICRHRHFRADAAQGARACRRTRAHQCRGPEVMDAEHLEFPDGVLRRGRGAVRGHHRAEPGSDARRVCPRAEARRRDRAGQPRRRRRRACAAPWSIGSRRRRASSAGAPSSLWERYEVWVARTPAFGSSSAARCRRSAISRSSASARTGRAVPAR